MFVREKLRTNTRSVTAAVACGVKSRPPMDYLIKIAGAALSRYLTFYVINMGIKRAEAKDTFGELKFGSFILILAVCCSLFTIGMFWVLFFTDHGGQETPIYCLIGMFGFFSIHAWLELIWTKGSYNERGIKFKSVWGGQRNYEWPELTEVTYNGSFYWYVLKFETGKSIRISIYTGIKAC